MRAAGQAPGRDKCQLWGVLNVTPDSFSDGGKYFGLEAAIGHARQMLEAGVDVIDVGGASSRPPGAAYGAGAQAVPEAEELRRVVPVVERLCSELQATVSVDTTRASVAAAALAAGASIVNDISETPQEELLGRVAEHRAQLVLMHNRGDGRVPAKGSAEAQGDILPRVRAQLRASAERAQVAGVDAERIWLDPGIGFAKTVAQSLRCVACVDDLVDLGYPVLVGPSRKAMIAEVAPGPGGHRPAPHQRDFGSASAVTAAILGGAAAVRVHEVAAMRQVVDVAHAIAKARGTR